MKVGDRIRDAYGYAGTVTHVLDGLDEACKYDMLSPTSAGARYRGETTPAKSAVTKWLHMQKIVPKTPRAGQWLAVTCDDGGGVLVGALDAVLID